MKQIQVVQLTADELKKAITDSIKEQFEELRESLPKNHPDEYLTRKQVCELLKVDQSTVWAWTKRGKLISYQISNRIYYKRIEVEQAIQQIQNL